MRNQFLLAGLVVAALGGVAMGTGDDEMPEMPKPQKQHEWLGQLVGEWKGEVEMQMGPDQPLQKASGTESVRSVGGFWVVSDFKGSMMGMPFNGVLSLGYDTAKECFVGTWVDSMSTYMWQYRGELDKTGKTLTLNTEGPCCTDPTTVAAYRETIEIKDKNHKVFTSRMQGEDGEWTQLMKIDYRRQVQPTSGKTE